MKDTTHTDTIIKVNIHSLTGYNNTVAPVVCQAAEPQIVTSSHESSIRLWDLAAGKSMATNESQEKCPGNRKTVHVCICFTGQHQTMEVPGMHFIQNLTGHNAIVNCLANDDNVMDPSVDNGSLHFWDFKTGYNFQRSQVRQGSMDSKARVFAMAFDYSGSRLITVEAT